MRVLLIEDEPNTAKAIELMLGSEGFNVYATDLGEEGLDLGKLYDYDIICLDLNLPDMHGYDVLKKLRVAKVQTPVMILSGIGEMDSKVRALGFDPEARFVFCFRRAAIERYHLKDIVSLMAPDCAVGTPRSAAPETNRAFCWSISSFFFLPIARRSRSASPSE